MEAIQTTRGGIKLCHEGHMYTNVQRQAKVWWACVRRSDGFKGSLSTDLARENPRPGQAHDHPHNNDGIEVTKVRDVMKRRARDTRDKPSQIVTETTADCEEEVRARLPTYVNVRSVTNALLHQLGDIPDDMRTTTTNQPFLLYDNGANRSDRILAFATEQGIRELARAGCWFMDGNFSMAPNIFSQINVIRIQLGTTSITPVFALLPNKRRETYEELFRAIMDKIEELGLPLDVDQAMTDFEDAVLRAVQGVFGRNIRSRGCFYHLTQSTWRKIQDLGLANHYKDDDEFRIFVGMMDGLAFLPLACNVMVLSLDTHGCMKGVFPCSLHNKGSSHSRHQRGWPHHTYHKQLRVCMRLNFGDSDDEEDRPPSKLPAAPQIRALPAVPSASPKAFAAPTSPLFTPSRSVSSASPKASAAPTSPLLTLSRSASTNQ
ncbi:hypothetical protein GQR58_020745 [Nymphon striatum]|nr:hypothetical protein GQR58_020745 [Nymphon striatum]